MRGLFVGRFQPFHNGHMKAVEWILGRCDELVIAVGSTQRSFNRMEVFTAGERIEMMRRALKARKLDGRCIIIPVSDINNNALWVSHVNSLCPEFDVVFSNNPLVKLLFSEVGKKVVEVPLFDRKSCDGSHIRKLMLSGAKWKELVPKEVAEFIIQKRGIERLRSISKEDKYGVVA
ncbi:MAG: Nicotinamide-nucleotide adenylyltransferase, NadM family [Candidatus Fermentimicrarchaeum limneticum]|uniref:Nicotinamide-nucleotide adenylyltransferase n=1 Tax=Fermentimicrarchaeum limneticum TaxID=2795018 RepID=A0A7D6BLV7_FERL1|nr:MAG: Nicotinamide-nucleotide adenylyltransferase, NadM family [Candidatus Fermentimicrarchaeum limneticum]